MSYGPALVFVPGPYGEVGVGAEVPGQGVQASSGGIPSSGFASVASRVIVPLLYCSTVHSGGWQNRRETL